MSSIDSKNIIYDWYLKKLNKHDKILITGGAGYIGSQLSTLLVSKSLKLLLLTI